MIIFRNVGHTTWSKKKSMKVAFLLLFIAAGGTFGAPVDEETQIKAPDMYSLLPDLDNTAHRTSLRCDVCHVVALEVGFLASSKKIIEDDDFEDAVNEICEKLFMDYGLELNAARQPTAHYSKFGDTAKGSWINNFFKVNCEEMISHNEKGLLRLAKHDAMDLEEVKLEMKCSDICIKLTEREFAEL